MAFIDPSPGYNNGGVALPPSVVYSSVINSTSNVSHIIERPLSAEYTRQMMKWRVPGYGWVTMFLNPDNLKIVEGKDIKPTRTKAGFILQYAGEKLTNITLSGTTGSAGIEGINILRSIYRAEQLAFDNIADELERTGPLSEFLQLARGSTGTITNTPDFGSITERTADIALNILNQPFPTLSSLAANIELYFQGELFRGYFTDFSVEESGKEQGLINYTLNYTAYARQGVRRNFMPWHRQPFNPIGASAGKANPLSYYSAAEVDSQVSTGSIERRDETVEPNADARFGSRSVNSASDRDGSSLAGLDFRL